MAIEVSQNLTQVTISSVGISGANGTSGTSGVSGTSGTSAEGTNGSSGTSGVSIDSSSLATTGSNVFDGDQTIAGFVSASTGIYSNIINPLVGSDTINLTATNLSGDNLTVNSLIVTGSVSGEPFQTFATTGSNTFVGNQTISGSINLDVTSGINFGNDGTYVGLGEGALFLQDSVGYIQLDAQNNTNYAQIILAADNEDFFYVNHNTTNNNLKFTTSGSLLLNEVSYDAHLATTGSNIFVGNQTISGSLNIVPQTEEDNVDFGGATLLNVGNVESQNSVTVGNHQWDINQGISSTVNTNNSLGIDLTINSAYDSNTDANGNVIITTNDFNWNFGNDGIITLPGDGVTIDTSGIIDSGQLNIVLPGLNSAEPQVFRFSDEGGGGELVFPDGTRQSTAFTGQINTDSFATTGSNTFVGDQTISGSLSISGSVNVSTEAGDIIISSSGDILLVGNSNITTTAGDITLQPFDDLRLYGGASTDENTEGGDVVIRGGQGPDEVDSVINTGGDVTIAGGTGGSGSIDSGGNGGNVNIYGGDSLTEAIGGTVRIYGGYGYDNYANVVIGDGFITNTWEFNQNTGELSGPLWTIDRGTFYLDTTTQDQKIFFGASNTSSFIGTNFGPLEIYDSSGDFKINSTNVTIEGQLNVTSSLVVTGSVEVVGSITASVVSSSYMKFDSLPDGTAPTYQEGLLYYDNDMGALTFYNNEADISLQIGQESYVRAINKSGGDILNGTPVRVSGSQGDRVKIYKAEAFIHTGSYNSSEAENHILGLATHDILNDETGYVTISGLVTGINTAIYEAGDVLYIQTGSAGVLTNVAPPFPYDKIQVGIVGRKHASVGEVLVLPKEPTHFGNITGLSGSTTTEVGDLWVYKSNNAWATSKTLEGDYTITGSLNIGGSGSLNGDNIVASNTIQKIETISSASYAALNPPVSGTLYIII